MTDMPQIELSGVNKHFGSYHALRDIALSIPKGAFVALVGPSGCGKSTLLRSIAGLEGVSEGTICITGQVMNDEPPRRRDVAMVFQSYALYPHMTVGENLTYSLRLKRAPKAKMQKAAEEVAKTIGLEDLLDRYPRELSGGQRQRVAMGRAIVRRPKVFLFDEPLSNLDAALRVHMRKEIRSLHDRLGATSVYVTHDQIEAMTMADHVVVMREGRIEQQGPPLELYDRPASRFVGGFIGSPAMNFVAGRISGDGMAVTLDLPGNPALTLHQPCAADRPVTVGMRPEHLVVQAGGAIGGTIEAAEMTGASTVLTLHGGSATYGISVLVSERSALAPGDPVSLSIAPHNIHLFDASTGEALREA